MREKDTLFLIFEEDLRFTPNDIEMQVNHTPAGMIEMVGDKATLLTTEDAEIRGEDQEHRGIPGQGRWYEMPTKVTDHAAYEAGNSVLHDIVKYATAAHRASCGDLTWMC
jgi:hypothetical protein